MSSNRGGFHGNRINMVVDQNGCASVTQPAIELAGGGVCIMVQVCNGSITRETHTAY